MLNTNAVQVTEVKRQMRPHISAPSQTPELLWEQTDHVITYLLRSSLISVLARKTSAN